MFGQRRKKRRLSLTPRIERLLGIANAINAPPFARVTDQLIENRLEQPKLRHRCVLKLIKQHMAQLRIESVIQVRQVARRVRLKQEPWRISIGDTTQHTLGSPIRCVEVIEKPERSCCALDMLQRQHIPRMINHRRECSVVAIFNSSSAVFRLTCHHLLSKPFLDKFFPITRNDRLFRLGYRLAPVFSL